MFITVVDGKKYIFLDSHCFCTLYQRNFSFPIYLQIEVNQYKDIKREFFARDNRSKTLKKNTFLIGSSGRPVAQSIIV